MLLHFLCNRCMNYTCLPALSNYILLKDRFRESHYQSWLLINRMIASISEGKYHRASGYFLNQVICRLA